MTTRNMEIQDAVRSVEVEIVNEQLERNMDSFFEVCNADLDNPCDCFACKKYEAESMAYAMADYKPKVVRFGDDEHGDELCDNALCACHDDCDRRDCDICFDHAVGQAEAAFEGER